MRIELTRDASQRPANGFEDPCGRVEYRTGPKGPLTQRSINRLGVRRIVFQRALYVTGDEQFDKDARDGLVVIEPS